MDKKSSANDPMNTITEQTESTLVGFRPIFLS
jgi:hypothetical protein